MRFAIQFSCFVSIASSVAAPAIAQDNPVGDPIVQRIYDEGMRHSQASRLAQVGPALDPPEPELQVSPVGRQSRLERSIWHCPPWQMFEQQSAFAAQLSLSTLQSPPPQRPLKQPSEQQSSAIVQAMPSATQRLAHWVTPDIPVTGSQRALQHSAFIVQAAPDA